MQARKWHLNLGGSSATCGRTVDLSVHSAAELMGRCASDRCVRCERIAQMQSGQPQCATLVYEDICRRGQLEDRREYDVEQLARMYAFTEIEATDLEQRIQRDFLRAPQLSDISAEVFKEYVLESQHSNWEGFTDAQRIAIEAMLEDLRLYAHHR